MDWKRIKKYLIVIIICILSGTILKLLVNTIPSSLINNNLELSAGTFEEDGEYPFEIHWYGANTLDNFTDSLMFLQCAYTGNESLVKRSLLDYRVEAFFSEENLSFDPYNTFIIKYGNGIILNGIVDGKVYNRSINDCDVSYNKLMYGRYWHGYQVILKPLLIVMDYNSIRCLNFIIQAVLILLLCILIAKTNVIMIIMPLILYLMLGPEISSKSLQYSTTFYISIITSLIIVLRRHRNKKTANDIPFLIAGIALAYFDLLTCPVLTLCIPLSFYLVLYNDKGIKEQIGEVIKKSVFWGSGYGIMWLSKWILASVFGGENVLNDAFHNVGIRMASNNQSEKISFFEILFRNGKLQLMNLITFLSILAIVVLFLFALFRKRKEIIRIIPFFIVSLIPFFWIGIVKNHSYVHYFFVNRIFIATCFSLFCGLGMICFHNYGGQEDK